MQTAERQQLELKAAAKLELRRRLLAKKTVFGIFDQHKKKPRHLYSIQEEDGEYVIVDLPYSVMIPKKLECFLTIDKRFKIAFGGRSGTKSNTIADILAAHAKDYGDKTLCVREIQSSIDDSVHALLKAEIQRLGFEGFDIRDNVIRKDGDDVFKYRGLWRNPDAVKSMFGFKYAWGEEAQSLSYESLEMLTPTIRLVGSELMFSFNPGSSADPIYQDMIKPFESELLAHGYYEDDLHLIVWINYTDNPWHYTDTELELEREKDEDRLSNAAYRHKWLGYTNDEVDHALIPVEHFDAAIDAHITLGFKGEGAIIAAHDPSDDGKDPSGYTLRHGSVFLEIEEYDKGDINDNLDYALARAITDGADYFVWDCDGMGIGLKKDVARQLKSKKIDWVIHKGSEGVEYPDQVYIPVDDDDSDKRKTNKEVIFNKRAQYGLRLADRFANTYKAIVKGEYVDPDSMISISSDIKHIDKIRAQVCRVPLIPDQPNGKIQIMSKKEMARKPLLLPSPTSFDTMSMSTFIPKLKPVRSKIKFVGWNG